MKKTKFVGALCAAILFSYSANAEEEKRPQKRWSVAAVGENMADLDPEQLAAALAAAKKICRKAVYCWGIQTKTELEAMKKANDGKLPQKWERLDYQRAHKCSGEALGELGTGYAVGLVTLTGSKPGAIISCSKDTESSQDVPLVAVVPKPPPEAPAVNLVPYPTARKRRVGSDRSAQVRAVSTDTATRSHNCLGIGAECLIILQAGGGTVVMYDEEGSTPYLSMSFAAGFGLRFDHWDLGLRLDMGPTADVEQIYSIAPVIFAGWVPIRGLTLGGFAKLGFGDEESFGTLSKWASAGPRILVQPGTFIGSQYPFGVQIDAAIFGRQLTAARPGFESGDEGRMEILVSFYVELPWWKIVERFSR